MGCDCHPYIETRRKDGTWRLLKVISYDEEDPGLTAFKDRNYRKFGILAGVRNSEYHSLFPNRGMPSDACEKTVAAFKDNSDYHSTTWFMVQELLDVDWDAPIGHVMIDLDPTTYLTWVEEGRRGDPDCLVVRDHDMLITEEELVLLLTGGFKSRRTGRTKPTNEHKLKPQPYVEVLSKVSYRDVIPSFVNQAIPALVRLGDPTKTRVIIGFDS